MFYFSVLLRLIVKVTAAVCKFLSRNVLYHCVEGQNGLNGTNISMLSYRSTSKSFPFIDFLRQNISTYRSSRFVRLGNKPVGRYVKLLDEIALKTKLKQNSRNSIIVLLLVQLLNVLMMH